MVKLIKYAFDNNNIAETKIVIGSGRSGTTWISHILNYENDHRYIFEPLHHLYHTYSFPLYPIGTYLRPDQLSSHQKSDLLRILSGDIQNNWINRYNRRIFSTKRIIKFIRAGFLISSFLKIYPELPIIYVMRHPLAVVNSRLNLSRQDHSWIPDLLKTVAVQRDLVDDYLGEYVPFIYSATTDFQKCLLMWCIQNHVGLIQIKQSNYYEILHYEKVTTNLDYVKQKITEIFVRDFSKINSNKLKKIYDRDIITTEMKDDRVTKWKTTFTHDDLDYTDTMLNRFNLDRFYSINNAYPLGD